MRRRTEPGAFIHGAMDVDGEQKTVEYAAMAEELGAKLEAASKSGKSALLKLLKVRARDLGRGSSPPPHPSTLLIHD